MSDMASDRITIRISKALQARLRARSRAKGQTPSDVIRVALEVYLSANGEGGSAFEAAEAAGVIGCAGRAPRDLSTNPRYLEGFGKSE